MDHEEAGAPVPFAEPGSGSVSVYRRATLIDGTGGPAQPSMTIVADGAQIVRVAPDDEVAADQGDGTQVFDLAGQFVIPGLIDSHQHLATPPDRPLRRGHVAQATSMAASPPCATWPTTCASSPTSPAPPASARSPARTSTTPP